MASKRKYEDEPNLSKDRKTGRVEENSEKPCAAKKPRVDQEKSLQVVKAKNVLLSRQLQNERKAKEDALISLQSAKTKNDQLSKQLENERVIKEDALFRLSSLASNKLRDNNPNIADLSDQNRPTKLSEQFSELYDNEWTDAFDELQKILGDKEDKEIISYLLRLLLEINSACSSLSASKLNEIQRQFVLPAKPSESRKPQTQLLENWTLNHSRTGKCFEMSVEYTLSEIKNSHEDENKVPPEIFKTIKDGIKSTAHKYLKDVQVHVHSHLKKWLPWKSLETCLESGNVKRYIGKCTEVCWYMSVQDPQLFMEGNPSPDGKFDPSKYREYTRKGPYQQFVVWPVLYLYRGGQMLSKGVSQGSKLTYKNNR